MSRDSLYIISGIAVFITVFVLLLLMSDYSVIKICVIAFLASIASDVIIIYDNEKRNSGPDAKLHHRNELVGETARVLEEFRSENGISAGKIKIRGETWNARSSEGDLKPGDPVRIIDREGMTFTVKKC